MFLIYSLSFFSPSSSPCIVKLSAPSQFSLLLQVKLFSTNYQNSMLDKKQFQEVEIQEVYLKTFVQKLFTKTLMHTLDLCLTNRNSVKNRVNSSWDQHDNTARDMTQEQLREHSANAQVRTQQTTTQQFGLLEVQLGLGEIRLIIILSSQILHHM